MKIIVKLFGKPFAILEFQPEQTIKDIKTEIKRTKNIDIEQQRLIFLREPLDFDFKTLQESGIKDGSTIYLMLRLFVKKETPTCAKITANRTRNSTKS